MNSISNNLTGGISSEAPQFSVVIPLYNKAHTIVHTLSTVMRQNYADYEVVIVDDGSTDNGVQLIREHFKDPRIRIFHQENAGVSVARNRGIEEAKGDWVAFLDADDEWLPDYLKYVVEASDKYPECGMVITGRMSQNYATHEKKGFIPTELKNKTSRIDFFDNPHVYGHISATSIRRRILENKESWNRFIPSQKCNEDFYFLFAVALHTNVVYVGEFLSVYNGNVIGQATSSLMTEQRLEDSILFHDRIMQEYARSSPRRSFMVFMRYEYRHIIKGLLIRKDYLSVKRYTNSMSGQILTTVLERFMYNNISLNWMSLIYINFTKLIWRMHGLPVTK